jgi:hypothetical protein
MSTSNSPFPALQTDDATDALDTRKSAADATLEARMLSVLAVPESDRLPFLIWESVDLCNRETCPATATCQAYAQADKYQGKCPIQHKYVRSVADIVFSSISAKASPLTLLEIGMHIIPLYNQLAKLKIIEASLGGNLMITTPKGPMLHPVAREIRACIMTINAITKEVVTRRDLSVMAKSLNQAAAGNAQGDEQEGAAAYYAELKRSPMNATRQWKELQCHPEKVLNMEETPGGITFPKDNGTVQQEGKRGIKGYIRRRLVDSQTVNELKKFNHDSAEIARGEELQEGEVQQEEEKSVITPELLPPPRRRRPKES